MRIASNPRSTELGQATMACRYALTGEAPATKLCGNYYDCSRCEYSQMLEDTAHLVEGTHTSELAKAA